MSAQSKPKVDWGLANKLIAEVDASDRRCARLAIKDGIATAEAQWLAAPIIAEALTLELMKVVQKYRTGIEAAEFLRALARTLEAQADVH